MATEPTGGGRSAWEEKPGGDGGQGATTDGHGGHPTRGHCGREGGGHRKIKKREGSERDIQIKKYEKISTIC